MSESQDTFIQPKITGYRQLTPEDAKQMNEVKELANMVGAKINELRANTEADARWISIAQTQLQQGFMALVRSIAKPDSF